MSEKESTILPAAYASALIGGNRIRQILVRGQPATVRRDDGSVSIELETGKSVRLVSSRSKLKAGERALLVERDVLSGGPGSLNLSTARWIGDKARRSPGEVLESLLESFSFTEANEDAGRHGLRPPQLGAVHSVLGYWTTKNSTPATVVMPTGTGKTETMLALFAVARPERLMVIVPSDALRRQTVSKFESFGVLQEFGVVSPKSLRPAVGELKHGFKQVTDAREFARQTNVIIATPPALNASTPEARAALLSECSHLFVDEAHHVAAATWRQIRDEFSEKPVVQFTATPFREDGKHLGGSLIYNFPLREAQSQGYFAHVNYASVVDLGDHDRAVAVRAVAQLRDDLAAGHDHLIMARVNRISRADDLLPIYEEIGAEFAPLVLHSSGIVAERRQALEAMTARTSRIIICVNMLGEGFDLPALKIAAIHDPHRSLGVTLQFAGRFSRATGSNLGDATVVVGRPDRGYDPQLRRLFAEDADWNHIIRDLSESAVSEQQDVTDFEQAFGSLPDEVAMQSLLPRMSTVVYRTGPSWTPEAVNDLFPEEKLLTNPIAVNHRDSVVWFVTENRKPVKWGELRTVEEVAHDLYVLYWDSAKTLLYINSSNTNSHHEDLAKVVAGEGATRIRGENIYRVMAEINRLVPTNVGLLDYRNRSRRFSMHVGADVIEGFPVAEAQTKTKTNIFAYGYEDGARVSIGASLKGRVWSYRVAGSLKEWVDWCDHVGAKLNNEAISVDAVMANFIRPKTLEDRPPYVPIALEWPWQTYAALSDELKIQVNGTATPLVDVGLEITEHKTTGPIPFVVRTPSVETAYVVDIKDGALNFAPQATDAILIKGGQEVPLADFLNTNGLTIIFEDDAVVEGGMLLKPDREIPPFDTDKLVELDWTGIDLTVESQGPERRPDSIQARVIEHVLSLADWTVVLDDDGTGEVADVVAMRPDGDKLVVHLVHCKFVSGGNPRAQVEDLYQVCGQAQKSVRWRRTIPTLFEYLRRRERQRLVRTGQSGFIKGDAAALYGLEDDAQLLRPELSFTVAQPGLSRKKVSAPQLELLAATEVYIHETTYGQFDAYCSA
jgi:superfamily II DNA or RNA helicase